MTNLIVIIAIIIVILNDAKEVILWDWKTV